MKRLHALTDRSDAFDEELRRGFARQREQRQLEHTLRHHIAGLSQWTQEQGWTVAEVAKLLHLCPRTLRQWIVEQREPTSPIVPLGRPTLRSPREDRRAVLAVLDELGPALGVPTLRECFPDMPRAELTNLLVRYRRVWRKRHPHAPRVLHWQTPGVVWAMDFSEAPCLVEGRYPYLLAVRDLASHQQLLWHPTMRMDTDETIAALQGLFTQHGPPLVLKTDNGSPFGAEVTAKFLQQSGVKSLFSPPHTPRYNGAIEAGIGSLKTRTERHAARHGHPGHWTLDDIAFAQADANATARPQGAEGPAPERLWRGRRTIAFDERSLFLASVKRYREEVCSRDGLREDALSTTQERLLDREAIRRALVEHGYLLFSRRIIPLPINTKKVTDI